MAYIRARKQSDGFTRYTAVIRIRKGKAVVHREAKTFAHRAAALTWARHREVELEDPAALTRAQASTQSLARVIRWYIDTFESISRWQRSKQTHLEFLERHPIGKSNVFALTTALLVDHVRSRRAQGAGPATVANDLTWIGVVLRAVKSVKGLPVRPEMVEEARTACRELRLVAKPKKRSRRPSAEELQKLREFFSRRDARSKIPMLEIMEFALHSARRQAEICRLEWRDNDPEHRTGLVRDAKHPTAKEGNHRRFKYTAEAWEIVQHQAKSQEFIFPFDPNSVGAAFTRACHVLGIDDLHFHDLRHEATSRLFERGYQIHEVAQFTLHDSWNELKRYANLRPEHIRELPSTTPISRRGTRNVVPLNAPRVSTEPFPAAGRSAQPSQPNLPATGTSGRRA
jgi:integrase